jgi:hypothetical protein
MTTDLYRRERTDRIIAQRFTASFMSDAKWVRLLHALTGYLPCMENQLQDTHSWTLVRSCKVKLVWDDELIRDLNIAHQSYNYDYYDHAVEAMISGPPRGWFDYKEIEWIEFLKDGQSNIDQIEAAIQAVGQFELEHSDQSLRLFAYK